MYLYRIFEIIKERLFAVSYSDFKVNILDDIQDKWTNPMYLEEFFENNKADLLSGFYGDITIEEAIENTIEEADILFDNLYKEDGSNLDAMFKPLNDSEYRVVEFQKRKAKGFDKKTWLRIYAVHYDDKYIITGAAIKLTRTMQDRTHTNLELRKLTIVRDALKLNEIEDCLFVNLDI